MSPTTYFKAYGEELILYIPAAEHGLQGMNLCVEVFRRLPDNTLKPEWLLSWAGVDPATGDVEIHFFTNYPTGRRGLIRLTTQEHP